MGNANFGKKLKEARLSAGLTQKDVYEQIDVPQSTFSEPDANTFIKLCNIYGIHSLKELDIEGIQSDSVLLSKTEKELVKKYRILDNYSKQAVDLIVDISYERICLLETECTTEKERKKRLLLQKEVKIAETTSNLPDETNQQKETLTVEHLSKIKEIIGEYEGSIPITIE